jgi:DNA recombination protein RmuC
MVFDWYYVVAFLVGGLLAGIAAYLFSNAKFSQAITGKTSENQALAERLRIREERIGELQNELVTNEAVIQQLRQKEIELRETVKRLETLLESQKATIEEQAAWFKQAGANLADTFKALSAESLKSNNQSFIELAVQTLQRFQERAQGELQRKEQAIEELVKPLKEALDNVNIKIQEVEKERTSSYASLKEQVSMLIDTQKELRSETGNLVKALRTPTVRGRWGEIQLKRVVELAGMVEYCDFLQQVTIQQEDGAIRPDMIVRLPNNKNIVIDSKAPIEAYLDALTATGQKEAEEKMHEHAKQVRRHLTELGSKRYWESISPTPEFVVLFLPGETFFSAALQYDPGLIEYGVDRNVILATPTTLIALLRAVSYGWQTETIAKNAELVKNLGTELYDRMIVLAGHFEDLRKSLERSVSSYNKVIASFEGRALVTARRFKELGVGKEEIKTLEPIELVPRPMIGYKSQVESAAGEEE